METITECVGGGDEVFDYEGIRELTTKDEPRTERVFCGIFFALHDRKVSEM